MSSFRALWNEKFQKYQSLEPVNGTVHTNHFKNE